MALRLSKGETFFNYEQRGGQQQQDGVETAGGMGAGRNADAPRQNGQHGKELTHRDIKASMLCGNEGIITNPQPMDEYNARRRHFLQKRKAHVPDVYERQAQLGGEYMRSNTHLLEQGARERDLDPDFKFAATDQA